MNKENDMIKLLALFCCKSAENKSFFINNICYKEPEYFIYTGKEKGPTILIIGATHGNEPAGYYGIKEYMNKLNKQEITLKRGKIIFVPVVNYCGLQLNSRNHNTVGDINRLYVESENNNISIQI